jgi:hypothetical protein
MTVKAVLRNGQIQPIEPLPANWIDGQELVVEDPGLPSASELESWAREMDIETAKIPIEEHDRFLRALEEAERESKDAVRREWGLS